MRFCEYSRHILRCTHLIHAEFAIVNWYCAPDFLMKFALRSRLVTVSLTAGSVRSSTRPARIHLPAGLRSAAFSLSRTCDGCREIRFANVYTEKHLGWFRFRPLFLPVALLFFARMRPSAHTCLSAKFWRLICFNTVIFTYRHCIIII